MPLKSPLLSMGEADPSLISEHVLRIDQPQNVLRQSYFSEGTAGTLEGPLSDNRPLEL